MNNKTHLHHSSKTGRAFSIIISLAFVSSALLSACGPLWGLPPLASPVVFTPTLTPFQPEDFTPPAAPTDTLVPGQPTDTSTPPSLWISPAVPAGLRETALAAGIPEVSSPETATIRLEVQTPGSAPAESVLTWYYALVTPFPTLVDSVSLADLRSAWTGAAFVPFPGRPLWMDESTRTALTALWGAPSPAAVRVVRADQLVDAAWAEQPALGIVPFEALEPRWKVLQVDGQSPVHNDFDPAAYPLKVTFSLQPAAFNLPATNRDPAKLTVVAMTGVTALVRATADKMETKGILYPGEEVRTVLRAADITHISNEIAFDTDCPVPNPWTDSLVFCSDPDYIALLEDVGADVIDLTGNHLMDYGADALYLTLDMYDQKGWPYFAGGRDLADSFEPATFTDHGNKIAFIGCNYTGPAFDWATETSPGSAPCDFDVMTAEIARLRTDGYLPIVTFQYNEYYRPFPSETEVRDFRLMSDAGAVIVSGSQAHVPAAMTFANSGFIHYGLGNLFFDQMSHLMEDGSTIYDTRNVFIDRHVFYDGKYVGTELLSYLIEDYARPRLMTEPERNKFLEIIFDASGW